MADPRRCRRFFMLCAAWVAFSLTAHFVADAACRSTELSPTFQCHSNGNGIAATNFQMATSGLHMGIVAPSVLGPTDPAALLLAVVGASFFTLTWLVSPPVQPPKALPIA